MQVEALPDSTLLEHWRAGDMRAGGALLKRHFTALHRFFSSKVSRNVEDLVQQTFAACVETKDAFRGDSTFRAYLFGVARFQLYAYYRHDEQARELDFTTTSVADLQPSQGSLLDSRNEASLLAEALRQVPLDQRIALELTYWEDMSAPEISRVLGVAENTVYSRVHRAKEQLRRALNQLAQQPGEADRALALLPGISAAQ